jgi:hypothetical protein
VAPVTGTVAAGGVTNDTAPTVSGTLSAALGANEVLALYRDGLKLGTASVTGTAWSYGDSELSDGTTYSYTARVENSLTSATGSASVAYALRVDTSAPAAPSLDVVDASDTGRSATDNLSRDATPTVRLTLTGSGATAPVVGDTVTLMSGGTSVGIAVLTAGDIAAGYVEITASSLGADGAKTLTATVTDAAGNQSPSASPLTYTLDTTAPTQTVIITSMTKDTGITNDFITSDGTAGRTVSGSLPPRLYSGETLELSFDGGTTWTEAVFRDLSGYEWVATDILTHSGNWTIQSRITDDAGNVGGQTIQNVTLISAPNQTAIITTITDDVAPGIGKVAAGGLTNDNSPTVSGILSAALGANEVLALYRDGVKLGTASVTGTTWSYGDSGLSDNSSYSYTARVENSLTSATGSASAAYTIFVDTNRPPSIESNGGGDMAELSLPENTTNVTTCSARDPDGNQVSYSLLSGDDAGLFSIDRASGVLTFRRAPDFEWPGDQDGDNVYRVVVQANDPRGGTDQQTLLIRVTDVLEDTNAVTLDLPASEDTGSSDSDNLINTTRIRLEGTAEPGAFVQVSAPDGTPIGRVLTDAHGHWSLDGIDLATLDDNDRDGVTGEDGQYTFTAVATDAAGHVRQTVDLTLTLDRTPPPTPIKLILDPDSDSLTPNGRPGDQVTADLDVNFILTLPSGARVGDRVRLYADIDGDGQAETPLYVPATGLTTSDLAAGRLSIPIDARALPDQRPITFTAILADPAGNASFIRLCMTAPSRPLLPDFDGVTPLTEDAGNGANDFNGDGVIDSLQGDVATTPLLRATDFGRAAQGGTQLDYGYGAIIAGDADNDGIPDHPAPFS